MFTLTAPILEKKVESKAEMKDDEFWRHVDKLKWCNKSDGVIRTRGGVLVHKKVTEKARELAQEIDTLMYRDNIVEYTNLRTKKKRDIMSHVIALGKTYYATLQSDPQQIRTILDQYQKCRHYSFDLLI
jgi:hypothetical protein